MRTVTRPAPTDDDSVHRIRWVELVDEGLQACQQELIGEQAAADYWNALHEASTDGHRRVNAMAWAEVVQVVDEKGKPLGTVENVRARFSHHFDELGVYDG